MEIVKRDGCASVDDLAQRFAVSNQTVRRDINRLVDFQLVRRYHGGASLPSSIENILYDTRQVLFLEEKKRIASLVAEHIPNGASLCIDLGTTTEEVARALHGHTGLRVITNNLNVAMTMSSYRECEVLICGGVVRASDRGITDESATDFIRQFKVDIGIIGISGIDYDGSLLDFDCHEVRVAQAIIAHSRQVYLVADHSKFGRPALVRLAQLSDIDDLFTDRSVPQSMEDIFAEANIAVHVAAGTSPSTIQRGAVATAPAADRGESV